MIKPKVVLLIFVSGKIVLTGAKVGDFLSFSLIVRLERSSRVGRFERRFTRLSTRSTLCFANSANLKQYTASRRSCLDQFHFIPHQAVPGTISTRFRAVPSSPHDCVGCQPNRWMSSAPTTRASTDLLTRG
jgi:hypothetical protein